VPESEGSVTAQVPIATLQATGDDLVHALIQALLAKGVITDADLADALKKLKGDRS
jgi:hypothetical protein